MYNIFVVFFYHFGRFENALRSKDPTVTLPYWDCSLDYDLEYEYSVVWSRDFMGGRYGADYEGAVAGWGIIRNQDYHNRILVNDAQIKDLLKLKTTGDFRETLETYHNLIHNWFGGALDSLETAAFDPVFFLLHCFVDYIWWQWQTNNKDQSFTWEYPTNATGNHSKTEYLMGISINGTNITNEDGYKQKWAFSYVTYEPRPACDNVPNTCAGLYLQCESHTSNRCRSKGSWGWDSFRRKRSVSLRSRKKTFFDLIPPMHMPKLKDLEVEILQAPLAPLGKTFPVPNVPDIVSVATQHAHYHPRHGKSKDKGQCYGMAVQNDFKINCESDSRLWAFLPVKVIHLRPHGKMYRSHLIARGKMEKGFDMYSQLHYRKIQNYIKPEAPISYRMCDEDDAGVTKVTVTSQGLNYRGVYKEYVILDNRQAVDGKVGYVAFKRPDKNMASKVLLTAFDQCGRICTPKCRGRKGRQAKYKSCSGVLNVDAHEPRRYGDTYGEAVLQYWKFNGGACPSSADHNIEIVFYCNYKNKWWPW